MSSEGNCKKHYSYNGRLTINFKCLGLLFAILIFLGPTILKTLTGTCYPPILHLSSKSQLRVEDSDSTSFKKDVESKTWNVSNNDNPHPKWCPFASCNNSPFCQPCQRRYIIILATGRSGSTTLTKMIDQLPGVRLAGENNNQMYFVHKVVKNLEKKKEFQLHKKINKDGAFMHNVIPEQSLACPVQHMFQAISPPELNENGLLPEDFDETNTIFGFKTIRFQVRNDQFFWSLEESIEFLTQHFPCAKILVNIRSNTEEQSKSYVAAFPSDPHNDSKLLDKENEMLVDIADRLGKDRAHLLDMSQWSKEDGSGLSLLDDALKWLGYEHCAYNALYKYNTEVYNKDETTQIDLGPKCRYSHGTL